MYDTIHTRNDDTLEISGSYWLETFIFEDFHAQLVTYFETIELEALDCYGQRVFVSTILGKDGQLKHTKIVKPVSPVCDSLAFYFVAGLKGWLPGLNSKGKFIDMPFVFPVVFDRSATEPTRIKSFSFLNVTKEEFNQRKMYFEFYYGKDSHEIINNFQYFCQFMSKQLSSDTLYTRLRTYSRPKRKERVKIKLSGGSTDVAIVIFYPEEPKAIYHIPARERWWWYWDKGRWLFVPNFTPPKNRGYLYLKKNTSTTLIAFMQGEDAPKLAVCPTIVFSGDTTLHLDFRRFNKDQLLREIERSPDKAQP